MPGPTPHAPSTSSHSIPISKLFDGPPRDPACVKPASIAFTDIVKDFKRLSSPPLPCVRHIASRSLHLPMSYSTPSHSSPPSAGDDKVQQPTHEGSRANPIKVICDPINVERTQHGFKCIYVPTIKRHNFTRPGFHLSKFYIVPDLEKSEQCFQTKESLKISKATAF